ncbi:MAG: ATP dependent DNA ligase [Promethearchaeota archaeon]
MLVDISKGRTILDSYWLGDVNSVVDDDIVRVARWYRLRLRKLVPASLKMLKGIWFKKGKDIIVMVKRDGEYNLLDYDAGRDVRSLFCNAPNSRGRYGLPVNKMIEERLASITGGEGFNRLEKLLKANGKKIEAPLEKVRIAGELWADVTDPVNRRPRVFDFIKVSRSPGDIDDLNRIKFDAFDLLSVNDVELHTIPYKERLAALSLLFPEKDGFARVIPYEVVKDRAEILGLYEKWVDVGGEEGLVIRSIISYKVKPVMDVDVVIIGFLEMLEHEGMVSSLLVALMDGDGYYRVVGTVGGGLSNELRKELFKSLSAAKMDSDYIHTSRDGRRYSMVRPEKIVQLEYLDTITENARGYKVKRAMLTIENGSSWSFVSLLPFVSLISPRFKRFRDDKHVSKDDLRLEQLGKDLVDNLPVLPSKAGNPSSLVLRVLFLGSYRGSTTLQKYLVWRTEKVDQEYPAYVVLLVSYNFSRSEPLKFLIRPASNVESAMSILDQLARGKDGIISEKTGKLKRGWKREKVTIKDAGALESALPSLTREIFIS